MTFVPRRLLKANAEMLSALPRVAGPLDDVPEVRHHARLDKTLPTLVEVDAPRVARALGEHLELMLGRVVAPHRGVDPLPLALGRPGLANQRRAENAVTAVKPAVRPPGERVQGLVRVGFVVPAIEKNPGFTRGFRVVPILDRHEHQMGRRANPHAAEADFNAADQALPVHEHRALVELPIAIGVLENQNAIAPFALRPALGVIHPFDHPEPPAVVDAERDGLHDVRFAGEERGLESRRQGHLLGGGLGRKAVGELHDVRRRLRRGVGGRRDERRGASRKQGCEKVSKRRAHDGSNCWICSLTDLLKANEIQGAPERRCSSSR